MAPDTGMDLEERQAFDVLQVFVLSRKRERKEMELGRWVGGKDLGEAEGGETRVRAFQGLQMAQQNAS